MVQNRQATSSATQVLPRTRISTPSLSAYDSIVFIFSRRYSICRVYLSIDNILNVAKGSLSCYGMPIFHSHLALFWHQELTTRLEWHHGRSWWKIQWRTTHGGWRGGICARSWVARWVIHRRLLNDAWYSYRWSFCSQESTRLRSWRERSQSFLMDIKELEEVGEKIDKSRVWMRRA